MIRAEKKICACEGTEMFISRIDDGEHDDDDGVREGGKEMAFVAYDGREGEEKR